MSFRPCAARAPGLPTPSLTSTPIGSFLPKSPIDTWNGQRQFVPRPSLRSPLSHLLLRPVGPSSSPSSIGSLRRIDLFFFARRPFGSPSKHHDDNLTQIDLVYLASNPLSSLFGGVSQQPICGFFFSHSTQYCLVCHRPRVLSAGHEVPIPPSRFRRCFGARGYA